MAYWILVVATILAGSLSSLGGLGSTISVEKDWVKALANGDADVLARLNSGLISSHSCRSMNCAHRNLQAAWVPHTNPCC